MRATDATFEHSAVPNWNIFREAISLNFAGAGVASNPAELDTRGSELDSGLRVAQVANRFIKTKWGLQVLLEFRVSVDESNVSMVKPAGAAALLFGNFLDGAEGLRLAVLSDCAEECI